MRNSKQRAWLTPDVEAAAAELLCRRFLVPDTPEFRQSVSGALLELTHAWNWEKYGTMTPDEAAAIMLSMYNDYALSSGCEIAEDNAPFWDDADADDADDTEVPAGGDPWYEELSWWAITAFLATSFTPAAAIQFVTTVRQIRFFFRKREYGGIFRVLWDDVVVGEIDTYSETPDVGEFQYYAPSASEHTLRIEHSGEHNPAATAAPDGYAIEIIRGRLRITGASLRYSEEDESVQFSGDGGLTWTDDPASDPRNYSRFPPPEETPELACDASVRIVAHMKELLSVVIGGAAGGATAIAWRIVALLVPGYGLIILLITLVVEGLIAIGAAALADAFLGDEWDELENIIFCRIGADGVLTESELDIILVDVDAILNSTAAFVVHQLFQLIGVGGANDAIRQREEVGDCTAYSGCASCEYFLFGWETGQGLPAGVSAHNGTEIVDGFKFANGRANTGQPTGQAYNNRVDNNGVSLNNSGINNSRCWAGGNCIDPNNNNPINAADIIFRFSSTCHVTNIKWWSRVLANVTYNGTQVRVYDETKTLLFQASNPGGVLKPTTTWKQYITAANVSNAKYVVIHASAYQTSVRLDEIEISAGD